MNSIRARLLLWFVAALLPVLVVSYGFLYVLVERSLRAQFQSDVDERVETLVDLAEWWDGEPLEDGEAYEDFGDDDDRTIRFEFAEHAAGEPIEADHDVYYQIWDASGVVQARSASLGDDDLLDRSWFGDTKPTSIRLPDDRNGIVVTRTFVPPVEYDSIPDRPDTIYTLAFAMSTEAVTATLGVIRLSMLVAGIATLALAGLVIVVVVRQGLKPLDSMTREIETIGEDDLGKRVKLDDAPEELRPVAARINTMLDRLHVMVERERRFTSDVAHELRTPLAELRTLAEVCARRDGMPPSDKQSFLDVKEIAIRLDRLTGTLLDLSRCSSGQIMKDVRPADLGRLIESTWQPFADAAASKKLDVEISTEGLDEITTDPLILSTILSNLFSNAVEYTPHGGEIRLQCHPSKRGIAVTLSNSTQDLSPQDLPKLAEKFWRKHGPDSRTHGHLGLGLTLVDALSDVLDARFECSIPAPGEFRARLVHPN